MIFREEVVMQMLCSKEPHSAKMKFVQLDDGVLLKNAVNWPNVFAFKANKVDIRKNHQKLFGLNGFRHRACHHVGYPCSATHCMDDLKTLLDMSWQFGLPGAAIKITSYIHSHIFPL